MAMKWNRISLFLFPFAIQIRITRCGGTTAWCCVNDLLSVFNYLNYGNLFRQLVSSIRLWTRLYFQTNFAKWIFEHWLMRSIWPHPIQFHEYEFSWYAYCIYNTHVGTSLNIHIAYAPNILSLYGVKSVRPWLNSFGSARIKHAFDRLQTKALSNE